jgi:hypothetical protein
MPRPGTGSARRYRRIYMTALVCYWAAQAAGAAAGAWASIWLSGYGRLAIWLLVIALTGLAAGQFDTQFAAAYAQSWFRRRQDAR